MNEADYRAVCAVVEAAKERLPQQRSQPVGGGCINESVVLGAASARYFVKFNDVSRQAMFEAEADGLRRLAAAAPSLRVPRAVGVGVAAGRAFLVLEHIEFSAASASGFRRLGRGLAQLHGRHDSAHGLAYDNWIGSTPQPNGACADWPQFFAERRLGWQLELAAGNGYRVLIEPGERLLAALPALLLGHRPVPSLLHGDLWSGNVGFDREGRPVLFDPACHYGDRECDLAMSELFGGFPPPFYRAYEEALPLDAGYPRRRDLYQLYHVLNHLNLFGGGYLQLARRLLNSLLQAG